MVFLIEWGQAEKQWDSIDFFFPNNSLALDSSKNDVKTQLYFFSVCFIFLPIRKYQFIGYILITKNAI